MEPDRQPTDVEYTTQVMLVYTNGGGPTPFPGGFQLTLDYTIVNGE